MGLWATFAALVTAAAAGTLVSGKVVDENGVAVEGAHVVLSGPVAAGQLVVRTDPGGRFRIPAVPPGPYKLEVLHEGFFPTGQALTITQQPLELELAMVPQQLKQTLDVVASIYQVDPQETSRTRTLTQEQIDKVPFAPSYDLTKALAILPGVATDSRGRLHINGGASDQVVFLLDGFNITNPVSGGLENSFNIDSIRAADVRSSRYSAEYGKGSSGVVAITTRTGDDRFRYQLTDFIPSFDTDAGVYLKDWAPRFVVSGPAVRNKLWFLNSTDAKYDLDVLKGLPKDADRTRSWRWNNLTRLQAQLGPSHLLSFTYLFNNSRFSHVGLDLVNPLETTRNIRLRSSFFSVKDQGYVGGVLIEGGFAINQLDLRKDPMGNALFIIEPDRRRGNFFLRSERDAERREWMVNLAPRPLYAAGRHDFKFGASVDRILYHSLSERRRFLTHRGPGIPWRETTFEGSPDYSRNNTEWSGYVQDRWAPVSRFLVELGLRYDRDSVVRRNLVAPRLAVTALPLAGRETKFSFGIGGFYDATNLYGVTRPLDQRQFETFYHPDGRYSWGPAETVFRMGGEPLRAARVVNWSVGWEQRLPSRFTVRSTFLQKRGSRGFTFVNVLPRHTDSLQAVYELQNVRRDKYDAAEFTVTQAVSEKARWTASYVRSSARTSAVLDYTIENPFFSGQGTGPLDWDMPSRFTASGWMPLLKQYTFSWFVEWRDGTPFSVINGQQELVGTPNRLRLPQYFSLNPHIEREVQLRRYRLSVRVGVNNITGRHNYTLVNNNLDSQLFRQYGGGQRRSFTFRIRYLGRK